MEACVAFINTNNHCVLLNGMNLKDAIARLEHSKTSILNTIEERKEELELKNEARIEAQASLKKAEQRENRMISAIAEANNRSTDKDSEINDWHVKDTKRKTNLKESTKQFSRLIKEAEELKKERETLAQIPENGKKNLEWMQSELRELVKQEEMSKKVAASGLLKFDRRSEEEKKKRDKFAEDYAAKNELSIQVTSELALLESELSEMRVTAGQGEKRLGDLKLGYEEATHKLESEKKELKVVTAELTEITKKIAAAERQIPSLTTAERDLRTRKTRISLEIEDLKHVNQQRSYKHHATEHLQKLKDEGEFPGFIGRLGDMGRVDKKYDVVISTIFCNSMDYHLVEKGDDSQFAIDNLRKVGLVIEKNHLLLLFIRQKSKCGPRNST
uniref:SMC hinge domain-containing protein n=1 Tax=Caenorhabditis japonica TaxID=281687 RepID=A0A8R1EVQ6_CAEJA